MGFSFLLDSPVFYNGFEIELLSLGINDFSFQLESNERKRKRIFHPLQSSAQRENYI